jgi:hypothetical protein
MFDVQIPITLVNIYIYSLEFQEVAVHQSTDYQEFLRTSSKLIQLK